MAKHVVARAADIPDGGRLIVEINGRSIGIFNIEGRFHALLNRCPHRGAELCRGSIVHRIEAAAPGDINWNADKLMLQCPWHGWEYDLESGRSYSNSSVRPYPVGVEDGCTLASDEDAPTDADPALGPAVEGVGRSGPRLKPGPYTAETFPLAVEEDYIVLTLPGRARRARS